MKRFLLPLVLGLGLTVSAYAAETCSKTATRKNGDLPVCTAIDSAVAATTSAVVDGFSYRMVGAQIYTTGATSVAVVNILCRIDETAPWALCYTVTNPGADKDNNAKYVTLARAYQYEADIPAATYVSGTITVKFERYSN